MNKYLLTLLIATALSGCSTIGSSIDTLQTKLNPNQTQLTPEQKKQKRAAIMKMHDETLAQLFALKPEAKKELQQAAGYGVFEAQQVNAVLVLGSLGDGVLVEHGGGKTFMKLDKLGTGPGLGYKSFRQVVIFKSKKLLEEFRSVGADVSASADATAKIGDHGGSVLDSNVSFNPYLSVYQFTDQGVLLQANWGGVMYKPDTQLNTTK